MIATRYAEQWVGQVQSGQERAHRLNKPGIAVDVERDSPLQDVVKRQGAVPPQMLSHTSHMRTNSWAKNTDLGRVAAPGATAELAITMEADENALAKYGLCMLDVPGGKLLNKDRLRQGAASLELIRRRLQLSPIVYHPRPAARRTDRRLKHEWKALDP